MQLEIYNPTQGTQLPTIEWNFDALKTWLEDGLASYKGRVYDDSQINEAKKDAANLRKLKEAIDGKRKELKRDYLEPYEAFASQAKLLTDMIDKQIEEISGQVKAYDTRWKEEKRQRIEAEIYSPMIGDLADLVPYDRLHEAKWLNRTASDSQISEALGAKIDRINAGLFAINNMELEPDLAAAVRAAFLRNFDLSEAMAEKDQIECMRDKAESEKRVHEPQHGAGGYFVPTQGREYPLLEEKLHSAPKLLSVTFHIEVTEEQLRALGAFMREHGIKAHRV